MCIARDWKSIASHRGNLLVMVIWRRSLFNGINNSAQWINDFHQQYKGKLTSGTFRDVAKGHYFYWSHLTHASYIRTLARFANRDISEHFLRSHLLRTNHPKERRKKRAFWLRSRWDTKSIPRIWSGWRTRCVNRALGGGRWCRDSLSRKTLGLYDTTRYICTCSCTWVYLVVYRVLFDYTWLLKCRQHFPR